MNATEYTAFMSNILEYFLPYQKKKIPVDQMIVSTWWMCNLWMHIGGSDANMQVWGNSLTSMIAR